MKNQDHSPTLDQWAILAALRFFLAATVVLGHFSLFVRLDAHHIVGDGYLNPGSAVFGFFILSGFSIAASVERGTNGFYKRRFLRIGPLYLAAIVFGLLVSALLVPRGFDWPLGGGVPTATTVSIIASILMLQMIVSDPIPIVGPIWSLSAEWWHYMVAPGLKRFSNQALLLALVLSFIAFMLIRPPTGRGIDGLEHGRVLLVTSWLWVTGFLYYRLKGTAAGFVILLMPSVFALTRGHFTGAPLFISVFVLVLSAEIKLPRTLIRPFNFLGDYSYALYLFHIPAIIAALALGSQRSIVQLGSAFAVSLIALVLVDYPSRKLFRRRPSPLPRQSAAPIRPS
jgi:peptidoglycan/LPS O-acetylase OafA/YrhL